MMVINTLYYIRKELPEAVFFTDCRNHSQLKSLVDSIGIDGIHKSPIVKDYWNIPGFINEVTHNYDAVIVLGGDDFSEYYTKFYLIFDLDIVAELSARMKLVMLGQTIGPFTPFIKSIAKDSLNNALIYTRDAKSLQYCRNELGVTNIYESRDLSLLDMPNQRSSDPDLFAGYGLTQDKYVTIVPSGMVECYCQSRLAYIESWTNIIYRLLDMPYYDDKLLFLLPHVLRESDSDADCILEVVHALDKNAMQRVRYTEKEMLPVQARSILGGGCYAITGRMHAGLSSLQMGKPAVFLSYSVKYQGVISMGMGMPELVIDAVGDSFWEDGTVERQVMEKAAHIHENYELYLGRIASEMHTSKDMVSRQISDVAHFLKESGGQL
jgi:colanic acid/amylovoran biosynthesis protein